ncbi:MAG: SH3 domain-containing protein [Gammaproteobacteria bacterium]|jgi:hypothetical protein
MKVIKKILIILTLLFFVTISFARPASCDLIQPINLPENTNIYRFAANENAHKPLISAKKQARYTKNFFQHFFSPWAKPKIAITNKLSPINRYYRKDQLFNISYYRSHRGYGENYQPNTIVWFSKIVANMDMLHFPNQDRNAIMVHNALVRYLPTSDPIFGNHHYAGQGYPFDNLQKSMLMVGTPIHIYQVSKQGDWVFVKSSAVFGWVKTEDIAYVDKDFITRWHTGHYVATVTKKYSVRDAFGIYRFHAYLGAVFPIVEINSKSYIILIPAANIKRQAVALYAKVPGNVMQKMPLASTPANFARVTQQLIGESYGWGGLFFLTDCSSALKNIYTAFGIWLPRNSGAQAMVGRRVNLSSLSPRERQDYIVRYGKPFTTLIHVPGHIMMYLGSENGKVMTFQNVWAFQTWAKRNSSYCEGRAIVGKGVIIPLELEYDRGMTPQIAVNELDISYL